MKKTGTTQKCQSCGRAFYVPGWRMKYNPKFCSMDCLWNGRKPPPAAKRIEKTCQACGTIYFVPPNRDKKTKFCSLRCLGAATIRKLGKPLRAWNKPRSKMSPEEWREQRKVHDAKYYRDNKERIHAEEAAYYAANKDAILAEAKRWREENPEKVTRRNRRRRIKYGDKLRAQRRQDYRNRKPIYVAQARSREKRIKQATPPWADLKAIERFYIEADRLTRETGIKHHVDHFYPLRSKTMCGLHVTENLQVVPAAINLKKGNSIPTMPEDVLCCAWPPFVPEIAHRSAHQS